MVANCLPKARQKVIQGVGSSTAKRAADTAAEQCRLCTLGPLVDLTQSRGGPPENLGHFPA